MSLVPKLAVFISLDRKGTKSRCDGARQHLFYMAFGVQFLVLYSNIKRYSIGRRQVGWLLPSLWLCSGSGSSMLLPFAE